MHFHVQRTGGTHVRALMARSEARGAWEFVPPNAFRAAWPPLRNAVLGGPAADCGADWARRRVRVWLVLRLASACHAVACVPTYALTLLRCCAAQAHTCGGAGQQHLSAVYGRSAAVRGAAAAALRALQLHIRSLHPPAVRCAMRKARCQSVCVVSMF
jgi:hypothetical protein